jgi:hypothetical protein
MRGAAGVKRHVPKPVSNFAITGFWAVPTAIALALWTPVRRRLSDSNGDAFDVITVGKRDCAPELMRGALRRLS